LTGDKDDTVGPEPQPKLPPIRPQPRLNLGTDTGRPEAPPPPASPVPPEPQVQPPTPVWPTADISPAVRASMVVGEEHSG